MIGVTRDNRGESLQFSKSFRFRTATSAFQTEGSPLADGAVASDWYRFTHERGKIERGENQTSQRITTIGTRKTSPT